MENTNRVPEEILNAAIERTCSQYGEALEKLAAGQAPEENDGK